MLTKKQKELFDFLNGYISKSGISPSFDEIRKAINLKSKSGVHRLVINLEQRGFIRRLKHKARAMEIIKKPLGEVITNKSDNNNSSLIPLLGSIAAGNPIEAINNSDESISVPSNILSSQYNYFGLKIKGDSMIDDGIFDGDIAIIKQSKTINNGKIAAVLIKNEEVTLKRIKFNNKRISLIPSNNNYKTKIYESNDLEIQGELKGLIRSYN